MQNQDDAPGITEDDIANYLTSAPDFFERHAQLLSSVQLSSGHGGRAVSLAERQAEMLREKIKGHEQRIMEMIRHSNENTVIANKMQRWTRDLLLTQDPLDLPHRIARGLMSQFAVPQATIKVWGVASAFASAHFAQGVSGDTKSFAASITEPYCGVNAGFEAVQWLDDPKLAMSVAMIALRAEGEATAFGLLVLASPDPQRFHAGMGTDFLERMGELSSAALGRLRGA